MRYLLVVVALAGAACIALGDDKSKAKAKAAAALNLAKAKAEAERNPVAAKPKESGPLTDLAKAKETAAKDGKALVVWVGEPAPAATLKAVDAVHCLLKEFPEAPKARAVVFRCRADGCDQKSSVDQTPTPELLKSMIRDSGASAETETPELFFIGTDMAEADVSHPPATVVTRYERRSRQVCTVDAFGRQSCRMVEELVPVTVENPAALEVLTNPAPPTSAPVSPPVVTYYHEAAVVRSRPVLFPRFREFCSSVVESRPRLFHGRFVNAIAARFRR